MTGLSFVLNTELLNITDIRDIKLFTTHYLLIMKIIEGNSGEVTSKEVEALNQLRKMATQRIKEQAERLFDSL